MMKLNLPTLLNFLKLYSNLPWVKKKDVSEQASCFLLKVWNNAVFFMQMQGSLVKNFG